MHNFLSIKNLSHIQEVESEERKETVRWGLTPITLTAKSVVLYCILVREEKELIKDNTVEKRKVEAVLSHMSRPK